MIRIADRPSRLRGLLALVLLVSSGSAFAGEPLAELLRRLPPNTNAIAVIDVKALYASPLGMKQGWKDKRQVLFDESILPKNVATIVTAAGVDFDHLGKSWNLALVDMERTITIKDLLKVETGTADVVSGREAVWTPRNAFYAILNPSLVARYSPASRQDFARWLKIEKQSPIASISPFLRTATNVVGRSGQMVLAIDLEDAFVPSAITAYLKTSAALVPNTDQAKLVPVLASIKGLTLVVSAQEELTGTLRVEFGESLAPLGASAKPLLLEVLSGMGAEIDDFASWDAVTGANEVVLKGKLGPGSMTRITSLFDLPSESDRTAESSVDTPRSPQSQAQATKHYFRSVQTLLDDLKAEKATGQKGASLWYERYARKVDQLPVLDVDPEMIGYGQWIADVLRSVSTSYYGVTAATGYRKTMTGGSGYYYGGYGGGGDRQAAEQIRRQENILSTKVYRDSWDEIQSKSSALRKEMTQKYHVEF